MRMKVLLFLGCGAVMLAALGSSFGGGSPWLTLGLAIVGFVGVFAVVMS